MEVHAHSHSPRKKFTHYLWDFLMLFLAVFCGFLAENFREHKVEQIRAHEYAESMVLDLQNDTAAIHLEDKSAVLYNSLVDSLLIINKSKLEGRNASKFSFYSRFLYWTLPISWNRTTFEQIKNSGSLRYFKNNDLLKKLMKYEAKVNEILAESNAHGERGNLMLVRINSIIDPLFHQLASRYFLWSINTISNQTRDSIFSIPLASLENKRPEINEMLNMAVVQQRNLRYSNETRWRQAEELARELITDLKKEYHLE